MRSRFGSGNSRDGWQQRLLQGAPPIEVAKQLQSAVWSAYNDEIGLTRWTHWLDVMSSTGLHSVFG